MKSILFLAVLSVSIGQIFSLSAGSCYPVSSFPDFDAPRYLGKWYEITRFDFLFEKDLTCVTAEYGAINGTHISVRNAGKNIKTDNASLLEGYAFVADPAVPNQLVVKLPIIVAGVTLFENPGDYQVWETDYDNYSIVYSCTQIVPGILKSEVTWILSRSKTLDGVFVQNLKNKLVAKHATFPVASFIPVAQDC